MTSLSPANTLIAQAQTALEIEIAALQALRMRLTEPLQHHDFVQTVHLILQAGKAQGRVVAMGMGKSGHVARKIAATLASTGTPAFFVHPAEALHGDLGMVQATDVVLALSNSGNAQELLALLPHFKRIGVRLIAMTGKSDSQLAQYADAVLNSAVAQEACPLNLAPTASTTAQMALGDALAVVLLHARGFGAQEFAASHPGGSLGRRLLTLVSDLMRRGDAVPRVGPEAPLVEMMQAMSKSGLGATAVVDSDLRILGIFTDGDLRRLVARGAPLHSARARAVMHPGAATLKPDALAAEAAALMEAKRISSVLVVDAQERLCGALNMHDLMLARVI